MKKKSTSKPSKPRKTTSENLEQRFDAGEDISDMLDLSKGRVIRRVNVDFPQWLISFMDQEFDRRGITRQALIKNVMTEYADKANASRKR